MVNQNYENLKKLSTKTRILEGINSLLGWDQETYMPPGSANIRGEQLKEMAGLIHQQKTGVKFKNALSKLVDLKSGKIKVKGLNGAHTAAIKRWYRDYRIETALPQKFVEEFAQITSKALVVWQKAKKESSFKMFAPFLEKIVQMNRKKADYIGYKNHPYDPLLDIFEPEMTTEEVDKIFKQLRKPVISLLKKIQSKKQINDDFLWGKFSPDRQIEFGKVVLEKIGYQMELGRLDLSAHPFSSAAHPTDSRITTRIHPNYLMNSITAVIHEAGHAMYEMGLPTKEYGTPLGNAVSLGIHESQSRWWETRIGLSQPFWRYFLPVLKKHFPKKLEKMTHNNFWKALNKVAPSLIRIEADEVSYHLHVILRFEIEKAIIEGSLKIRNIPEVWNEKMVKYLGVKPKNNSEGCLQDIHWAFGGIGYFPTYSLGTLYSSQFFSQFEKDHPRWENQVAKGEFRFINEWLHKNIYRHGRRYSSKELLKKVTGKGFTEKPLVDYLSKKYKKVYNF